MAEQGSVEGKASRRLGVVFVADVVGYSRLMSQDEAATLARMRRLRDQIIEPIFAEHGGRTIKWLGDGVLAEFASAAEAVEGAISIQRRMSPFEADLPQEDRLRLRIGLNLGDIIEEDGDIFGDGVNIAARLEALCEPGGIALADTLHEVVRDKLEVPAKSLGEKRLKNIGRRVRVYQIGAKVLDAPEKVPAAPRRYGLAIVGLGAAAVLAGLVLWNWGQSPDTEPAQPPVAGVPTPAVPEQPPPVSGRTRSVIAVLPFRNMSEDEAQDYFADGISKELLTDLGRITGLRVIPRSTAFAYKKTSLEPRELGTALGADYLVQGSVLRDAGQLRISAQLVDAKTGEPLWSERFDRGLDELFTVQDELVAWVGEALRITLTPREMERLRKRPTGDLEAYDAYLRALARDSRVMKDANAESRGLFEKAIGLDPEFAAAFSHLAQIRFIAARQGWSRSTDEDIAEALALAEQAVVLDPDSPHAYWGLARILGDIGKLEPAIDMLQKALALDPNFADGHATMASLHAFSGQADMALASIGQAKTLNPRYPFFYDTAHALTLYLLERYEEAVGVAREGVKKNPNSPGARRVLIAALGQLGRDGEAAWQIADLDAKGFDVSFEGMRDAVRVIDPASRKKVLQGFRKAGARDRFSGAADGQFPGSSQ